MTIETTLPPPLTKPWFTCTTEGCETLWQAFHGKVGCYCNECSERLGKKPLFPEVR